MLEQQNEPITPVAHPDTYKIIEEAQKRGFLEELHPQARFLIRGYYIDGLSLSFLKRYTAGKTPSQTGQMILSVVTTLQNAVDPNNERFKHVTLKSPIYASQSQERARLASIGREPVNKGRRKI